ncbi:MAG: SDR family oxidoreductase [Deltaproteobacteria bacterium]|nr:SDR family oxidoreductase [Deltaproteobacteria bacterium]
MSGNVLIAGSTSRIGNHLISYFKTKDYKRVFGASRRFDSAVSTENYIQISSEGLIFIPEHIELAIITIGDHIPSPVGTSPDVIQKIINSNLTTVISIVHQLSDSMKNGNIIVFSDALVSRVVREYSAYYAAKAGLETFVRAIAREMAPEIRINCIAPGIMNLKNSAKEDALERWSAKVPLGTLGGMQSVVTAVEFIVESEYMTGSIVKIDGGISC